MQVKAKAKYIRISPRKARLVADVVRGLDAQDALNKLALINKKAVVSIEKLLKSAIASAEHNHEMTIDNLFVKAITVNDGPTYYRWMPRAFGRATQLRKRTSIIDLVVAEKVASSEKKTVKKATIKTEKLDHKIADKKTTENVKDTKKESIASEGTEEKKEDSFQKTNYKGTQTFQDNQKKEKGAFKKMFRRKSGM